MDLNLLPCVGAIDLNIDWNAVIANGIAWIMNHLLPLVTTFLLPLIYKKFEAWMNKQTLLLEQQHTQKEANHESDMFYNTKLLLMGIVKDCVLDVSQTYMDALKAAKSPNSPGGAEVTKEEKDAAYSMCYSKVMAHLTPAQKDILTAGSGDLTTLVDTLIESNVKQLKMATEAAKSPALPTSLTFDPNKKPQ
jgi:hypothetical protein